MRGTDVIKVCTVMALVQLLGGCAALAVAGVAGAGAVAVDRRTAGTMVDDEAIELKAREAIVADKQLNKQSHLNVTSYNGRVLLTGETPSAALRAQAVKRVSGVEKVKHVYDYVRVAAPSSLMSRSSDTYITGKVKTELLAHAQTSGIHVKVVTENGVVYLMGLMPPQEAKAAVDVARKVGGVQRVVNLFQREPAAVAGGGAKPAKTSMLKKAMQPLANAQTSVGERGQSEF